MDMWELRQRTKGVDVRFEELAAHTNAGEVVKHHAGAGVFRAHRREAGERVGADERAEGEAVVTGTLPHFRHAGRAEPGVNGLRAGVDAEAAHALLRKFAHRILRTGGAAIHYAHAGEHAGEALHRIKHVAVV